MTHTPIRFVLALMSVLLAITAADRAHAQGRALVPTEITLGDAANRALAAEWLTDEERATLRVFHGVWDDRDLRTADDEAFVALNAWDFNHPVFDEEETSPELRAEARLLEGRLEESLELLEGVDSIPAARIRAEALEQLGRLDDANDAVDAPVRRLLREPTDDPEELTEAVRALFVRARVQGQPARDFQTMLDLLGRAHQELDRLYWPAKLAEAELLFDKESLQEAVQALHEVLDLNPRCAEAWYMLGRVALRMFDFASAEAAAEVLRRFNREHPLADLLLIEARLTQDDPERALEILDPLLFEHPTMRPALEFHAAAKAILYDEDAMHAALERYDELSPGSPRAYYVVGRHLSFNRQYEAAAEVLDEAIRRKPNWPPPQIEQGLMELQSGRDAVALSLLRDVVALDPFNKRAINSLNLLEELADYQEIETDHFIIRYKPGIDEIMVEMMPDELGDIHRVVTDRFGFEPDRKTILEMMPDHQRFAVRITGMPFIHTMAAATGPVIAMEVPREGPRGRHTTTYDWPRVLQHEYTHTVTLAQTRNRIPHWLTEAAAVEMELAPRDYNTAQLLARSLEEGSLFDLDAIKWAFVRPEHPQDRAKAYAQGHWMLEFMNDRFGESAVIRLFERYFEGEREAEAIPGALGVSREQFFHEFLEWARKDVQSWGLAASPSMHELTDDLRRADPEIAAQMEQLKQARLEQIVRVMREQVGRPRTRDSRAIRGDDWPPLYRPPVEITDEQLEAWLEEYPDHPDLVELKLRRAIRERGGEPDESLVPLLERYAELRPVDPFPHQRLAQLYLASDDPTRAIPHLEELDAREQYSPTYAVELARLYRKAGEANKSFEKATRALHINPYHAANRELAAALAIEADNYESALMHIRALTKLEPDRPQHQRRLEAIQRLIDS